MSALVTRDGQGGGVSADALAQGLGWFSIGLGLAELLAPQALSRGLGLEGKEGLIRAAGAREIATGIGLLSTRGEGRAPWLWGRVGGDAMDVALLATALDERNPRRGNAAAALAAVIGVTVLDLVCAQGLRREPAQSARPMRALPDYSGRSGFPRPAAAMRGAASDCEVPRDMRAPEALQSWLRAPRGAAAPG